MTKSAERYRVCPDCGKVVKDLNGEKHPDGKIKFHISDAGVAGDPMRLLIGTVEGGKWDGQRFSEMCNPYGWFGKFRLKKARNLIIDKANILLNLD